MKVTITLSEAEVRGIKAYLKAMSPDINQKITNEDVKTEIKGMVNGEICNGAIGDYVWKETHKANN